MDINEVVEPFARLLDDISPAAAVRAVERGGSPLTIWEGLAESGFLDALVPEESSGAGLTLADVLPLIAAIGARAVPLPVAETMAARALLAQAGIVAPRGPIELASAGVSGQIVPCGQTSEHVLVDDGAALVLAVIGDLYPESAGVEASLGARLTWKGALSGPSLTRPAGGLRPLAAVLRAGLIAGAAERLVELTAAYANERVQFGKPIGRQQALQQNLAVMAEDVVAARIAAQLGAASGFPPTVEAAATAKAIASESAARIANTAHAVHGAIGISEEHDLQLLTRRLHQWRLVDGSEGFWHRQLGALRRASASGSVDWVREAVFD